MTFEMDGQKRDRIPVVPGDVPPEWDVVRVDSPGHGHVGDPTGRPPPSGSPRAGTGLRASRAGPAAFPQSVAARVSLTLTRSV